MSRNDSSSLKEWRRQMIQRLSRTPQEPSELVALSYLADGPVVDYLVEVERLTLVVLFEEANSQSFPAVHMAGFCGRRTNQGVVWGGPASSRFFKDLTLKPDYSGRGRRIDTRCGRLLELGLLMNKRLQLHSDRYAHKPRPTKLPLPALWGGFHRSVLRRLGLAPVAERDHFGLHLCPLEAASHHATAATTILADIRSFQRIRVVRLPQLIDGLTGRRGRVSFDFFNSRFRWRRRKRHTSPRRARPVSA